jgi:hypothetical protein
MKSTTSLFPPILATIFLPYLALLTHASDATPTQNNTMSRFFRATLQPTNPIHCTLTTTTFNTNGTGIIITVDFSDFPSTGGIWSYYIADAHVACMPARSSLPSPPLPSD